MTVPTGTVADVLAWVGDDPARAEQALNVESVGQNRSTLISQLEAIADEEDAVMAETDEVTTGWEEPPEQSSEVVIDPEEASFTMGTFLRDADVEVPEGQELIPADAVQVEYLAATGAPHGFILVVNGSDAYAFTAQMAAVLKQIADKAIAGAVL